jgi:hypothetical protein
MTDLFDQATMGEAFARDGMDPRLWVSFGIVEADTPDGRSVLFKDDAGKDLPYPTVLVTLQPSGTTVPCRVASSVAGSGEGEWYPFVAGDEVIVVISEGHERAGCTIVGRLNQTLDTWPSSVAGQDATTNTFGFKRMLTPYILETGAALLVRQATTGAFASIDSTGAVAISNGDNHALHIGHDFVGLALGDNSVALQLLPSTQQLLLQALGTQLLMDGQSSQWLTGGILKIGTSGIGATGHAITAESVAVAMLALLTAVGAAIPGPIAGGALAAAATGIVTAAIAAASALPIAPLFAAVTAALSVPQDPTGALPGYGKPGLQF